MPVPQQTVPNSTTSDNTTAFTNDYLDGVEAIADYLGWSVRKFVTLGRLARCRSEQSKG